MEGNFFSKSRGVLPALFFLIVGTVGGFVFGRLVVHDFKNFTVPELVFMSVFVLFFLMLGCLGIVLLLYNRGAYFRADEEGICTRFGLYSDKRWKWSELLRVDFGANTLMITLQDNKEYQIAFLSNVKALYRYCKQYIAERELPSAEILRKQILSAKRSRNRYILYTAIAFIVGFGFFMVSGYLADKYIVLTKAQTVVFLFLVSLGVATCIFTFFLANRCGKHGTVIRHLQSDLIIVLVCAKFREDPMPPNVIRILYFEGYTYRLVLHKEEERVPIYYYFLEAFDLKTETFSQTHLASPIFASELEMLDAIYELYDDEVFKERAD